MINWQQRLQIEFETQDSVGRLPTISGEILAPDLPQCLAEFLQMSEESQGQIPELGDDFESDSVVASRALRPEFDSQLMFVSQDTSIGKAIHPLGLQCCKIMAMSAAVQSLLSSQPTNPYFPQLLRESQERALFAQQVARILGANESSAYLGALLQDLMLPHLALKLKQNYDQFASSSTPLVECEQQCWGWTHARYSARLLANWNFPPEIVASVLLHHAHAELLTSPEYHHSEVMAVALSSLLPGYYPQEPRCVELMQQYQEVLPECNVQKVAADVDALLAVAPQGTCFGVPLSERLASLTFAPMRHVSEPNHDCWLDQTLGNYTLEALIGKGGMGMVYRARHSMLRRPAAVKMIKGKSPSLQVQKRFEVEAQITSELSSPHTVQVYDYGTTPDGSLYYVMEYLDGICLNELVRNYGPLPEGRVIHILSQVCGSLAESHQKGLIHRDIKPENIALTVCAGVYDFVKVLDFGLVAIKNDLPRSRNGGKIVGTPAYISPEAIKTPDQIDERADLYALGAVAYFCLTGEHVFGDLDVVEMLHAHLTREPKLEQLPCRPEFRKILSLCLQKNPRRRPQSVMEVARMLSLCQAANDWSFENARQWWEQRQATSVSCSQADTSAPTYILDSSGIEATLRMDQPTEIASEHELFADAHLNCDR